MWNASSYNSAPPVTSYNVYHNVTLPDSHVTTNTYFVVNEVPRGCYYFAVSANNVIGEGDNITVHLCGKVYMKISILEIVPFDIIENMPNPNTVNAVRYWNLSKVEQFGIDKFSCGTCTGDLLFPVLQLQVAWQLVLLRYSLQLHIHHHHQYHLKVMAIISS